MGRFRVVLLAVGVAGASLALASCGGGGGGGAKSFDLVIGDSLPLTGDLADFGPPGQKAAEIAVGQINKGIQADNLDQTVKLLNEDNETKPDAAVSVARKMVDEGASCIAGAWASADTIPTARSVAIPDGVLEISPSSTSTEITPLDDNGLVNRTPPADNLQGAALAGLVERELGGAKGKVVSVAGRNDSYGDGLTGSFIDNWEAKGGKVTNGGKALLYDPEATSYDSEAQQIVSGNPDGYVIVDFPETFIKVGPALVRTGKWDPAKSFVTDGLVSSDLAADPKNADFTEGLRATAPGTPTQGKASEAFNKLFTSSPPKDVGRQTFDGQNFDAVILCYLAAVAAGSTDGQDMADHLQDVTAPPGTKYTWEQLPEAVKALQNGDDIDYIGASGGINLDENGDPTVGVYDELQFKGGEISPIGKQIPLPSIHAVTQTG
jgi:ABC-type branched-subunit amino acid transport system substrate-binding protein